MHLSYIEKKQRDLHHSRFCTWLRDDSYMAEDKISFIPSMTFFVLGFRDILRYLEYSDPKTDIEKMINIHCKEDSFHWKWFLKDLERLGFNLYSWGPSFTDLLGCIWSDEESPMRDMVYKTILRVKINDNPKISLIIIEVLEAAFGTFINNMTANLRKMPAYEQLEYFGELHLEHEESHSMGHWGDGCQLNTNMNEIKMSDTENELASKIIDELFLDFENLFDTWFLSKDKFSRMSRIYTNTISEDASLN